MTPAEVHESYDALRELGLRLSEAETLRDAAACQLAKRVSDMVADGAAHNVGSDPYTSACVEIFNHAWTDWQQAHDAWRAASDRFVRTQDELAAQTAGQAGV